MPKIAYLEFNGTRHVVDVKSGMSVMEGAVRNGLPGIEAECGGACSCATCHVYVDPDWLQKLPKRSSTEDSMLDFASDPRSNSRLSCQLKVNDELEGLVVHMPENKDDALARSRGVRSRGRPP